MRAKNMQEIGMSLGFNGKHAERMGKQALIAANDNAAEIIAVRLIVRRVGVKLINARIVAVNVALQLLFAKVNKARNRTSIKLRITSGNALNELHIRVRNLLIADKMACVFRVSVSTTLLASPPSAAIAF